MQLRPLLLCFLTTLSPLLAEDMRDWILSNGHIFPARFVEQDKKNVVLELESGKKQRVPAENLGTADRFYLHDTHSVPIADLEGGDIRTIESKYKVDTKGFKLEKDLKIEVGDASVELQSLLSPNFVIFSDRGAKTKEYTENYERMAFSHAYRLPDYETLKPPVRRAFLFIKDGDLYNDLGKTLVETLREEGKTSERNLNQLELDWQQYRGHRSYQMPAALAEEYGASPNADIQFAQSSQDDRQKQAFGYMMHLWNKYPQRRHLRAHIYRSEKEKFSPDRKQSSITCYMSAITFTNHLHFTGAIHAGVSTGGGESSKVKFLPFGNYGEPKTFGKELVKKISSGEIIPSFETFYKMPSGHPEVSSPEEYRDFGLQVAGLACFMDQDLRHQFSVCRLAKFMQKKRSVPEIDEMPEIFGYESLEELDEAFTTFLTEDLVKMKY